jgi:arylsulfatase A
MKHRRTILATLLVAAVTAVTGADSEKPNIVYILADDLGYGDVHSLNPERGKIATPHLDQLASQGMTFTDAHSGSSVCTPTRYGVLTGRYAWRSRLQSGVLSDYVEPLISSERLTVPAFLREQGYHTACIGKWHLGFTIEGGTNSSNKGKKEAKTKGADKMMGAPIGAVTMDGPVTRGFDEFFGFHHARIMKSLFEGDRVTQVIEPVDMLPSLVTHTSEHIKKRAESGAPFFLYLALNSPHTPIVPGKDWQGKSGLGDYGDFVMETDWAVGEVLSALDKTGIAENTLVIFTSDNGCSPAAGTGNLESQGHFASAQFRGYKADIWDGGHRVPFFVRWPGKVKAGSVSGQLICHTDLMATCSEILGSKVPDNAGEDSISFLPTLLGGNNPEGRSSTVHHSINGSFALREGKWKLELCAGSGGWSSPKPGSKEEKALPDIQLYDLSSDISESRNVSPEEPEVVARLTKQLEEIISQGRSTAGEKQANDAEIVVRKKSGNAAKAGDD